MATEDRGPLWSDTRQATLTAFQAQLYLERAGLEPLDALKWWEHHVFSGEAATAISTGWSLDEVVRARELGLTVSAAMHFGEHTGLGPREVLRWAQAGVSPDEAAEGLAAGWSLDETLQRHPEVVQRTARRELELREEAAKWARSEAASRRLGEQLRAMEDAEHAQRHRRASMVDSLKLHVDASGSAIRFRIAEADQTYWAFEIEGRKQTEIGETNSLAECLALVADRLSEIGGTIHEVTCEQMSPAGLLAVSEPIAHRCARQVIVTLPRHTSGPPPWYGRKAVEVFYDVYDDDGDADCDRREDQVATAPPVLVARRVAVDDTVLLVPALPEEWPGVTRHSDSVASLGNLYLISDSESIGWELIGRFENPSEGVEASLQVRRQLDRGDKA